MSRSVQRRFLRATGMSHNRLRQVERARRATTLLREGMPPLEVAFESGYFDQAHLTRRFKDFLGTTPGAFGRVR